MPYDEKLAKKVIQSEKTQTAKISQPPVGTVIVHKKESEHVYKGTFKEY